MRNIGSFFKQYLHANVMRFLFITRTNITFQTSYYLSSMQTYTMKVEPIVFMLIDRFISHFSSQRFYLSTLFLLKMNTNRDLSNCILKWKYSTGRIIFLLLFLKCKPIFPHCVKGFQFSIAIRFSNKVWLMRFLIFFNFLNLRLVIISLTLSVIYIY